MSLFIQNFCEIPQMLFIINIIIIVVVFCGASVSIKFSSSSSSYCSISFVVSCTSI